MVPMFNSCTDKASLLVFKDLLLWPESVNLYILCSADERAALKSERKERSEHLWEFLALVKGLFDRLSEH